MFNVKVGSIIKTKYSEDVMKIVSIDDIDNIPCYEAKWINYNGSLSKGSLLIYGSQINDYRMLPAVDCTDNLFDQAIPVLRG